jgi:prevent-host-death family protein
MVDPVNIHDAKTHFSKLIERVLLGEEIVIAKAGKPVAMLVPITPDAADRSPGSARGAFLVPPDFDEALPDEVLADW